MNNSVTPEFCFPSIFDINKHGAKLMDTVLIDIFPMIPSYLKSKFWQRRVKSAATLYGFYLGIIIFLPIPDIPESGTFGISSGSSPKSDLLFLCYL